MSSIVLGVGNGKALFTGTSVAPDEDLVRFADPTDSIINAFDLSVLRGDGIFEATTVWRGFRSRWRIISGVSRNPQSL